MVKVIADYDYITLHLKIMITNTWDHLIDYNRLPTTITHP